MALYLSFGFILFSTFVILSRFSLINALVGCLVLIPFSGFLSSFGVGVTASRLLIFPFFLVFLFGFFKASGHKDLFQNWIFILVWFIFATLTVIKGAVLTGLEGQSIVKSLIKYGYFITGVGIILFGRRIKMSSFLLPLGLGGLFLSCVGFLQVFSPELALRFGIGLPAHFDRILPLGIKISGRINALHGNPNATAIYYGIAALAFEWLAFQTRGFRRFFYLLGLLFCFSCLILTFSRAGCFSFALCSILLILILPAHKGKGYLIPVLSIGMLFVIIPILFSARKFGGTSDVTRLELWSTSLKDVGSGFWELLLGSTGSRRINTHSGPLQILYDYGILGFMTYILMLIMALSNCIKRLKTGPYHSLIFCVLLYFILIDMVHSSAISSIIFWTFLAATQLNLEPEKNLTP